MTTKTRPFDAAEHLKTDKNIKFFLQDAAEGTPEEFVHALNTAKTRTKAINCRRPENYAVIVDFYDRPYLNSTTSGTGQ